MKRLILIFTVILVLSGSVILNISASAQGFNLIPADAGNTNDYGGGGGGWDFGGGDYGTGGGSFFFIGDGTLGGGSPFIIIIFIGVAILFAVLKAKRNKGPDAGFPSGGVRGVSLQPQNNNDRIEVAVHELDPTFDYNNFIEWSKEIFIKLQQAWTARDWEQIRPFEKQELYSQHKQQLEEYIRLGRINIIERISVKQAYLNQYKRDASQEYLTVYMEVRMTDYIIEESTGKVIKGNPNVDSYLNYLLTFTRKKGTVTKKEAGGAASVSCPHCGAPVQVTSAGKCEFCGSVVTTGTYDWVLMSYNGIKPGTPTDSRPVVIEE